MPNAATLQRNCARTSGARKLSAERQLVPVACALSSMCRGDSRTDSGAVHIAHFWKNIDFMIPAVQRKHCRKEAYQANRGGMSVNGYITAHPYIVLHAREFSAMLPYAQNTWFMPYLLAYCRWNGLKMLDGAGCILTTNIWCFRHAFPSRVTMKRVWSDASWQLTICTAFQCTGTWTCTNCLALVQGRTFIKTYTAFTKAHGQ